VVSRDITIDADTVSDRDGEFILTATVPLARRPTLTSAGLRTPIRPRLRLESEIDGFGTYPMNLSGSLNRLPAEVWWRAAAQEGKSREFRLAVIPRRPKPA
jgi:hypothetical protein